MSLTTNPAGHVKGMAKLKARCDAAEPTTVHHLMTALHGRGKLLRWYTQNIDALESRLLPCFVQGYTSSAPAEACVALHGSLALVWCIKCATVRPWEADHTQEFQMGLTPVCNCGTSDWHGRSQVMLMACTSGTASRPERQRRAHAGCLIPYVRMYGADHLPGEEVVARLMVADRMARPDVVLVMGTSMAIPGIQAFLRDLKQVRRAPTFIFVSIQKPNHTLEDVFDFHLEGLVDDWARALSAALARSSGNGNPVGPADKADTGNGMSIGTGKRACLTSD